MTALWSPSFGPRPPRRPVRRAARWRRLAVALHAVSTSKVMACHGEYVARVEALRPALTAPNPPGPQLERKLRAAAAGVARGGEGVRAVDLLSALSSFVDDYRTEPPRALFVVPRTLRLLAALDGRHCLTAREQLRLALADGGPLFDATLALHAATRVLARGRDARLHRRLALDLDERLRIGRAIAPFDPDDARGGDPLGDTYHFWANVAAGLFAGAGRRTEVRRHAVGAMLFAGPLLMSGVRERMFGNRLFYGNHARVDRLGLRIGYALARGGPS